MPDLLQRCGLKMLLERYFEYIEIEAFASVEHGVALSDFSCYITDPVSYLTSADFFFPRKQRCAILVDRAVSTTSSSEFPYLILKEDMVDLLVDSLNNFLVVLDNATLASSNSSADELSAREIQVLQLVVSGVINKDIAIRLNISMNTVLTHRKNITAKLGIKTISGLTLYALMHGYIST